MIPRHSSQLLLVTVECHLSFVHWVPQPEGKKSRFGSVVPAAMTTGHLCVLWCVWKLLYMRCVCVYLTFCEMCNFSDWGKQKCYFIFWHDGWLLSKTHNISATKQGCDELRGTLLFLSPYQNWITLLECSTRPSAHPVHFSFLSCCVHPGDSIISQRTFS